MPQSHFMPQCLSPKSCPLCLFHSHLDCDGLDTNFSIPTVVIISLFPFTFTVPHNPLICAHPPKVPKQCLTNFDFFFFFLLFLSGQNAQAFPQFICNQLLTCIFLLPTILFATYHYLYSKPPLQPSYAYDMYCVFLHCFCPHSPYVPLKTLDYFPYQLIIMLSPALSSCWIYTFDLQTYAIIFFFGLITLGSSPFSFILPISL